MPFSTTCHEAAHALTAKPGCGLTAFHGGLLGTFNQAPLPPVDGFSAVGLLMGDAAAARFRSLGRQMRSFSMIGLPIAWRIFDPLFGPVFHLSLVRSTRAWHAGGRRGMRGPEACLSYFFSSASMAAWAMASSTSDAAPLQAMAPTVWPSTKIGTPP